MKQRLLIFLLILSVSLTQSGCKKSHFTEKEPNNNFSSANIINENSAVKGSLKNKDDFDVYKLNLREYTGKANAIKLSLSGVKGMSLTLFVNRTETILNLKLENKVYYLEVKLRETEGNVTFPSAEYTLKIELIRLKTSVVELEPNNTIKNAFDIEPNVKVTGYFSPFFASKVSNRIREALKEFAKKYSSYSIDVDKILKNDVDLYRLRLQEQEKYNASIILNTTDNVNALLFLADSNGKILEFRNNHGYGEGEGISNLSLKGGKIYYIGVIGVERTIHFDPEKDSYTLIFKTHSFASDQEVEPNNDMASATVVSSPVTKGFLSPVKDQDWYKLTITPVLMRTIDGRYNENLSAVANRPSDRIMKVELSGITDIDLAFEITDQSGAVLKKVDTGGAGEGERIENFNVSFGNTYYIVVKGSASNSRESFKKQYKLKISFRDRIPSEEAEPNDTKNQGIKLLNNQIKVGSGISGYISSGGDVDYFFFTVNSPGKYRFAVTGVQGVRYKIEVFDTEDFSIGRRNAQREGESVAFETNINSTGVYYIVIKDARGRRYYNHDVRYFLTVKNLSATEQNEGANASQ
jgi:hypothetical protein